MPDVADREASLSVSRCGPLHAAATASSCRDARRDRSKIVSSARARETKAEETGAPIIHSRMLANGASDSWQASRCASLGRGMLSGNRSDRLITAYWFDGCCQ